MRCASQLVKCCPCLGHDRVVRFDAHDPQGYVIERCPQHSRLALDVQAPAPVLGVGTGEEIVLDLLLVDLWYGLLRGVPCDGITREEESGPAVFASPVATRELEVFEVGETIANCVDGGLGWL